MLGLAMGRIGLSYSDFCELTFDEFDEVAAAWAQHQEYLSRERWEQTRCLAYHSALPYMKRKMSVDRFMPLPWDRPSRAKHNAEPMTAEQRRERMETLRNKFEGK